MDNTITIDQFAAVELRVGKIISAEQVEGSEKLLLLQIDVGEDSPRTILSGISKNYEATSLENRKCVVATNLAPRKMMGMESNGMLICVSYTKGGDEEEVVEIIEPPTNTPVGTRLS